MTHEARDLLERALKLPAEDREMLVGAIQASLDEDDASPDPKVRAAWREEIARRVREYREGKVTPIPAEQVHAEAHEVVARARARHGLPPRPPRP